MAGFNYTPEQLRAIQERGGSILVSAAAGSGKTRILVERIMAYIENEGRNIDEFLIITYTRAAAAELRSRISTEISERLSKNPRDSHLRRQSALCHKAEIGTIHSFCSKVLKENAHLLEIDPGFRMADELESEIIKEKVLDELLNTRYENIGNDDDFRYLADTVGAGRDDSRLVSTVLEVYEKLQSLPYTEKWMKDILELWENSDFDDAGETVWGRFLLQRAKDDAVYWLGEMERARDIISLDERMEKAYGDSFDVSIAGIERLLSAADEGYSAMSGCSVEFPRLGVLRKYEDKETQDYIKDIRDSCKKAMAGESKFFSCSSQEAAEDLNAVFPAVRALFSLIRDFDREYLKEKRRKSIADFSDLEHMCLQLLADENGLPTALAKELSERYTEILVDEYQDVNEVQDLIFKCVSRNEQNIFMVGDVKQSIYRFRMADPGIFLEKYEKFGDAETAVVGEARKILLSKNFRSRMEITEAVNKVFSVAMSKELGELDYTEREALIAGSEYPAPETEPVELHILDAGDGSGDNEESTSKAASEAAYAAELILDMVGKLPVSGEGGSQRPLQYGDIAVLMRSVGERGAVWASVLRDKGIPVTMEQTDGFFETFEISIVLSILTIVDNPRQDIPLISALTSPVWNFIPDELSAIRAGSPDDDFYTALENMADRDEKCRNFLRELNELRTLAPDMPSDRFLWHIYTKLGILEIMEAAPGGPHRKNNLMRLLEYSRKYDGDGYRGFFSFVSHLRKLQETGVGIASGTLSSDAVRIMSIHKSKGLEYPVIILAGLNKKFNKDDLKKPILIHTELGIGIKRRDMHRRLEYPILPRQAIGAKIESELLSEEMRVLYVAMTRAKEKLIMLYTGGNIQKKLEKFSRMGDEQTIKYALRRASGMGDWLLAAIYGGKRLTENMAPAGCPWLVNIAIAPEYLPGPGKKSEEQENVGVEEVPDTDILAEIKKHLQFKYAYPTDIPSKLTATQLKGRTLDSEVSEESGSERPKTAFMRPSFAREKTGLSPAERGTALHLVMQYIKYENCTSEKGIEAEIERLENKKFITREQALAVSPNKIYKFFQSKTGQKLMSNDNVRREFKFSVLVPADKYYSGAEEESVLLQGVVDCYIDDSELTVIDFKTDYVNNETITDRAESYRPQLEAYSEALEKITGKKVRERVLYFFSTGTEYRI